jgi:hypothetical protein
MTEFYDRTHIDDAAAARTIAVDTGTVRVTDFNLDRDTQDLLFRKGREATLEFLDGALVQPAWDWEGYKRTLGYSVNRSDHNIWWWPRSPISACCITITSTPLMCRAPSALIEAGQSAA